MRIFTTALKNNKNTVKFSIKIPHRTSTVHRLLSDRLLCWKEPILASHPSLGLLHKRSPRLHTPFPNARSERKKIQAQNDRTTTNLTQNPSTYTVVSLQTRSSPWNRRRATVCFKNFQFRRFSRPAYTFLAGNTSVNCLKPRVPSST